MRIRICVYIYISDPTYPIYSYMNMLTWLCNHSQLWSQTQGDIYVYTYIYIHIYIYVYTYIQICIHKYIYTYKNMDMLTWLCNHSQLWSQTPGDSLHGYVYVHLYIYIHIYTSICIFIYIYKHINIFIYMNILTWLYNHWQLWSQTQGGSLHGQRLGTGAPLHDILSDIIYVYIYLFIYMYMYMNIYKYIFKSMYIFSSCAEAWDWGTPPWHLIWNYLCIYIYIYSYIYIYEYI
jgi:hypothetical protein